MRAAITLGWTLSTLLACSQPVSAHAMGRHAPKLRGEATVVAIGPHAPMDCDDVRDAVESIEDVIEDIGETASQVSALLDREGGDADLDRLTFLSERLRELNQRFESLAPARLSDEDRLLEFSWRVPSEDPGGRFEIDPGFDEALPFMRAMTIQTLPGPTGELLVRVRIQASPVQACVFLKNSIISGRLMTSRVSEDEISQWRLVLATP